MCIQFLYEYSLYASNLVRIQSGTHPFWYASILVRIHSGTALGPSRIGNQDGRTRHSVWRIKTWNLYSLGYYLNQFLDWPCRQDCHFSILVLRLAVQDVASKETLWVRLFHPHYVPGSNLAWSALHPSVATRNSLGARCNDDFTPDFPRPNLDLQFGGSNLAAPPIPPQFQPCHSYDLKGSWSRTSFHVISSLPMHTRSHPFLLIE